MVQIDSCKTSFDNAADCRRHKRREHIVSAKATIGECKETRCNQLIFISAHFLAEIVNPVTAGVSCCQEEPIPFVASDERGFRRLNVAFGLSRIANSAYQKWPTRSKAFFVCPIFQCESNADNVDTFQRHMMDKHGVKSAMNGYETEEDASTYGKGKLLLPHLVFRAGSNLAGNNPHQTTERKQHRLC